MTLRERVQGALRLLDRNALTRDAAVVAWARTLAKGARVLDVGAGTCRYREHFAHCDYVAQDHPAVDYAPEGVLHLRCDIASIPLPDASVDAILCTEVLEHVEEPLVAIDEFARLLKRGGRLFLSVPAACRIHRVPTMFYGGFGPDFFEQSLPARGLALDRLQPVGKWSVYMAQELGRVPEIVRSHTRVPAPFSTLTAAALWPMFRIAVPVAFLAFSTVDESDDLPLGWIAYASRNAS